MGDEMCEGCIVPAAIIAICILCCVYPTLKRKYKTNCRKQFPEIPLPSTNRENPMYTIPMPQTSTGRFNVRREQWLNGIRLTLDFHMNPIYSAPIYQTSTDRSNESVRPHADAHQPGTEDNPGPSGGPGGLAGITQSGPPPSYEEIISQSRGKPCVWCNHIAMSIQGPYVTSTECTNSTCVRCPYCQYDDTAQPPSYDDAIAENTCLND